MNDNNIPIVEPIVDYTKIPPIHQKRTISFINHFIVSTVSFLNKFALKCEERLYEFENKLQKLEAAIVILEARLASIPGLEDKSTDPKNTNEESSKTTEMDTNILPDVNIPNVEEEREKVDEIKEPETPTIDVEPISKHPLYEKYFKMVNVGVLKAAVKLKMTQEGLDPSLLDDPQKLIPKAPTSSTQG